MKKRLLIAIIIVILICSCSNKYKGWQTIDIEKCGTLKIPNEWSCIEENGLLYFLDENMELIAFQTESRTVAYVEEQQYGELESNKYFDEVQNLALLSSCMYGNGACQGKHLLKIDGEQHTRYYIKFGYDRSILMIFWDESITEDLTIKIANSFGSY